MLNHSLHQNKEIDKQSKHSSKTKHKSKFHSSAYSSAKQDGYDSQEDLENLVRISLCESHNYKKLKLEDDESISIDNRKYFKIKKFDTKIFNTYRFLNSLSIIILLFTFYSTTISQMKNKKEYSFILEFLRRDKIQAESNLIVLSIAFCFVTFSSIIALFRNIFIRLPEKEKDFTQIDIESTISKHFKYFYFTGNFLFSFCLVSNQIQKLEEYGVNFFVCILTLVFYFISYYNLKVKGANLKLKGVFNQIAFSYNISFLLAWNASYITITFATFLSCFKIDYSYLNFVNLTLQFLLSIIVVLALSYFQDLGFSFIILFFQWGNTLNENVFQFKSYNLMNKTNLPGEFESNNNFTEIKDEFNLNLILTIFTSVCFLSSAIFYYFRTVKGSNDGFIDELADNYKEEGEKTYL